MGGRALGLACEKIVATESGDKQVPPMAWIAIPSELRLEHSAKSSPERSVSQSTACIGSSAG